MELAILNSKIRLSLCRRAACKASLVRTPKFLPDAEVAQLVELLPSKQIVASSSLVFRSSIKNPH